ncbi:MAG: 4-(cytidine 5'-diphospho)-2-C-methyl-D-erythritol kinase [Alkalilacustris sp.]
MPPLIEDAPAKVNLCLHVTGRRTDGYHLLDSLVVFAGVGDRLRVHAAPELSLALEGPFAGSIPPGADNLVMRAARRMQGDGDGPGAALVLDKVLPPASGLGGGSADAAAAMRALARLWGRPRPDAAEGLALGADVPVCLEGRAVRMTGIGEGLEACPALPAVWIVLANPGHEVPTRAVFETLARRDNPPMSQALPQWRDAPALAGWLTGQRNDLEAPARALVPVIGTVLAALAARPGCLLARMSGSGATCFGLFADAEGAARAAAALRAGHPGWWIADAPVLTG